MTKKDITPFIGDFLNLLLQMFSKVFDTLDSIEFFGFSLLTYFISLFVLMAVVPILITVLNTVTTKTSRSGKPKRDNGGANDEK